jgi:hypothetical protein
MKRDISRLIKEKDELSMNLILFQDLKRIAKGKEAVKHYAQQIQDARERLNEVERWIKEAS